MVTGLRCGESGAADWKGGAILWEVRKDGDSRLGGDRGFSISPVCKAVRSRRRAVVVPPQPPEESPAVETIGWWPRLWAAMLRGGVALHNMVIDPHILRSK